MVVYLIMMMRENLVHLSIEGICMDKNEEMPVVLLRDRDKIRMLAVPVGPFEANAIIMMLKGIRLPRMLTHELFAFFMAENKFSITKLVIYGKTEETYKASLFYKRGRKTRLMDVRPSDGIALIMQFQSPIYAPEHLLQPGETASARYCFKNQEETMFIENDKSNLHLM